MELILRYSENVHEHSTIEALAAQFIDALTELAEHCRGESPGIAGSSSFDWEEDELRDIAEAIDDLQEPS